MKLIKPLIFAAAFFSGVTTSSAQIVFQDNFDSKQSGLTWVAFLSASDAFADFAYDYSSIGVPPAPNSAGTTIGMNFLVNQSAGLFQGISASPLDQHFTGDFSIRFDMWFNFIGPFPGGGSGSTQMASFGWGADGTTVQWAGATNSVLFAGSGDGGVTQDYRAYGAAGGAPLSPTTGVYAAGTSTPTPDSRDNTDVYYASLGGKTAPTAQTNLFPNQTGTTATGTLGMAWHDMLIQKSGDTVTWSVDGLRIASVPLTGLALGGDNITFGMFDINNGSSTDQNDFLNTAIFDNIRVTIPEPSAALLGALGLGALFGSRRQNRG